MEQHIQAVRVANAIMLDNSFTGYYLIVEGPKDTKLFGKYINHSVVRIREAFGRDKVETILSILSVRNFSRKVGVTDSDFDEILGIENTSESLIKTDDHDIEVTVCKSKAFEEVLNFFCSTAKIESLQKQVKVTIRTKVFDLAQEIGYLKLVNKVHNMGLHFRPSQSDGNQLKYKNFIDERSLKFEGTKALVETVLNYSNGKCAKLPKHDEIESKLIVQRKIAFNLYHIVNGHDLSNILFLVMKKTLSSSNKMLIDHHSVEDALLLAFDYDDFKKSQFYQKLKKWAIDRNFDMFKL